MGEMIYMNAEIKYLLPAILFFSLVAWCILVPVEEEQTTGVIEDKYSEGRRFGGQDYFFVIDGEEYEVDREDYHDHTTGDRYTHTTHYRQAQISITIIPSSLGGALLIIYLVEKD